MGGSNTGIFLVCRAYLSNLIREMESGESRLYGFGIDETKFPGGLKQLVDVMKEKYGVKFVCIHRNRDQNNTILS